MLKSATYLLTAILALSVSLGVPLHLALDHADPVDIAEGAGAAAEFHNHAHSHVHHNGHGHLHTGHQDHQPGHSADGHDTPPAHHSHHSIDHPVFSKTQSKEIDGVLQALACSAVWLLLQDDSSRVSVPVEMSRPPSRTIPCAPGLRAPPLLS